MSDEKITPAPCLVIGRGGSGVTHSAGFVWHVSRSFNWRYWT